MRRVKTYGDISDPRFRCFGCCHVRTGALCLGFYHLVIQTVAVLALLFAITRPEIFWERKDIGDVSGFVQKTGNDVQAGNDDAPKKHGQEKPMTVLPELPTPQPQKSAQPIPMDDDRFVFDKSGVMIFTKKRLQSGDAHLALALLVGLFFITTLMLHGIAKNRPAYLLPFFCFQVFDLILSCLTAVGHYTWLPNLQEVLANNPDLPFRDQLMDMNSQWVALCILTAYVIVLFAKAYFIGIIWACYQYLHLRLASVISYTVGEDGQRRDDGELLLPPDYESALKMPQAGTPPPPYGTA